MCFVEYGWYNMCFTLRGAKAGYLAWDTVPLPDTIFFSSVQYWSHGIGAAFFCW